jgi:hypothetical protein
VLDVDQKAGRCGATKDARGPAIVEQFNVAVLTWAIGEPIRCTGHCRIVAGCGRAYNRFAQSGGALSSKIRITADRLERQ